MATSPGSDLKSDKIACGEACPFPSAIVGSASGPTPTAAAAPAAPARNSRLERNISLLLSPDAGWARVTQFQSLTLVRHTDRLRGGRAVNAHFSRSKELCRYQQDGCNCAEDRAHSQHHQRHKKKAQVPSGADSRLRGHPRIVTDEMTAANRSEERRVGK